MIEPILLPHKGAIKAAVLSALPPCCRDSSSSKTVDFAFIYTLGTGKDRSFKYNPFATKML